MAIDHIPYRDTEEFARVQTRRFWPVNIPLSHWQLRHLVTLVAPNELVYAAGSEVFCLNTQTKKHKLIATLPFNARCIASGCGWVGVGAEKEGHYFAAIKLDGSGPRTLDVDAPLPLDTWRGARRSPSVRVEKLGEQIVNSISIHRLRDEEAHLEDVVAVLTNNDKTVRVFSLPLNIDACVLDLPHPVNHATISPDGKSMIVVGDFAQAFVYRRRIRRSPPQIPKPHNRLTSADVSWDLVGDYDLYLATSESPKGYFTTAWSQDGRFVAVGSEDGHITVFNAAIIIKDQVSIKDAVVTVIPSSRASHPNPYPGAVRSMIFSPAPWDLLIWAEDQGRVCVSDLRNGLRSKQILVLDPKDSDLVQVTDTEIVRDGARSGDSFDRLFSETTRDLADMEADFLRRHRDHGLESNLGYVPNYVEARRWERQRAIARLRTNYTDDPHGLTAREQQILDTLRESRQRQEAHLAELAAGASSEPINYTNPDVLAPYSMRARMMNADSPTAPELVRTGTPSSTRQGDDADRYNSPDDDLLTRDPPQPSNATEESTRVRAIRDDDHGMMALAQTWSRRDDVHRSGRSRGQWPSIFLPTPPRSQPATSSPAPESAAERTQAEIDPAEPEHAYNEADATTEDDDDDDADDADASDDIWRSLDDAVSNTRGPLFEYAARVQADTGPRLGDQDVSTRADAAREEREFRQRYLTRQRERLRLAREEAAASLSRANDYAALPTLSRTRAAAAAAGFEYEGLLRRRGPDYGRDTGTRTAGLAMSDDGSTLWAACEEGIFEFQMNRKARMFWPAVEPR